MEVGKRSRVRAFRFSFQISMWGIRVESVVQAFVSDNRIDRWIPSLWPYIKKKRRRRHHFLQNGCSISEPQGNAEEEIEPRAPTVSHHGIFGTPG